MSGDHSKSSAQVHSGSWIRVIKKKKQKFSKNAKLIWTVKHWANEGRVKKQRAYCLGLGEIQEKLRSLGRGKKKSLGQQLCMGHIENEIYGDGSGWPSFKCSHPFGTAVSWLRQPEGFKAKARRPSSMGVSAESPRGMWFGLVSPLRVFITRNNCALKHSCEIPKMAHHKSSGSNPESSNLLSPSPLHTHSFQYLLNGHDTREASHQEYSLTTGDSWPLERVNLLKYHNDFISSSFYGNQKGNKKNPYLEGIRNRDWTKCDK